MEGDLEEDLNLILEGDSKGQIKQDLFELDIEVITNLIPASFMFEISLINFYNFSQIISTIWFYLH